MDVNSESTAGWDSTPPGTDGGAWCIPNTMAENSWGNINLPASTQSIPNTAGENSWENIDLPASAHSITNTVAENSWENIDLRVSTHHTNWVSEGQVTLKSAEATTQPGSMWDQVPAKNLKADIKPMAPVIERPAPEFREVEVPDSAIPHIIGQARRTINALQKIPGITQVMTYIVKGADKDDQRKTPVQRVKVTGSSMAAINRVITQINRIVLRSATNSTNPEVSIICLQQKNKDEEAISLRLATAEEYQHYLSKHLKSFVIQHSPQDVREKKYFLFGRRVPSDQQTDNSQLVNRKRRRSYAADDSRYLFGSWDKNVYTNPISTCLRKFFEVSGLSIRDRSPQMKMRIELGKMFYFGTDLRAPDTWNVSLSEMETMTLEQTLKPCFSCYCHTDTVMKARNVLRTSGYVQKNPESLQDTVCAELVDMDIPTKPSFNIRFMQRDEIAAKINRKARRHAFVTFVDEEQRHDLRLRIQSRQNEPPLDEKTRRSVYDGWIKRAGIEDPLISPTGHSYYPMKVLHKVFEYYKKGETDIVLTRMSPVTPVEELQDENADISCRWKISLQQSFCPTWSGDGDVEHIVTRVAQLVDEAKKLSEAVSSG